MIHCLARYLPLFLLALLLAGATKPALAAHAKDEAKKSKYANAVTRRRQAVGQRCAKKLEAAQRAITAEQWAQSEQVLVLALWVWW